MLIKQFFKADSDLSIASICILGISNARLIGMLPDPVPMSMAEENFFFLIHQQ